MELAQQVTTTQVEEKVMTPLVSVVVITRNRADSLARTLDALAGLDYPDYEVIVVDNGSTDHTAQVAAEYSARYVFCPPSEGISRCRQRGVDAARGDIIAMCDDDCVPVPEWLQHIARRLCAEADLALVGGHVVNVGFEGAKRYKGRSRLGRNGLLSFVADPRQADFFGNANLAFKRSVHQAVGGYDPFFKAGMAEIDLVMSLRRRGYRIDYEPAAVVEHYHTGINFRRGRVFFCTQLMRLYFYMKHCRPRRLADWLGFLGYEFRLTGRDLVRALRALAATAWKGEFKNLSAPVVDLFNAVSTRLAIPWLLWRLRKRQVAGRAS